jgi:hypothetical protein
MQAIKKWMSCRSTSPMTNLPLPRTEVVRDRALQSAIRDSLR